MTKRSLPVLVLLNAVLLAALSVTVFAPVPVQAQFGAGSQYMMIAGHTRGRNQQAAVYVIDLRSSRMAAVMFNSSNNQLDVIAGTDIGRDVQRFNSATR